MFRKTMFTFVLAACAATLSYAQTLHPTKAADWNKGKNVSENPAGTVVFQKNGTYFTTASLPVKNKTNYFFTLQMAEVSGKATMGVGFTCYDKEGKMIRAEHVEYVKGTDTFLVLPCKETDAEIVVKDASNWKATSRRCIAFETEPDLSDLPNRNFSKAAIKKITKLADGNWKIELKSPVGKKYPAGTGVREHQTGSAHKFLYYGVVPKDPINTKYIRSMRHFRPGTKSIKLMVLVQNAKDFNLKISRFSCSTTKD